MRGYEKQNDEIFSQIDNVKVEVSQKMQLETEKFIGKLEDVENIIADQNKELDKKADISRCTEIKVQFLELNNFAEMLQSSMANNIKNVDDKVNSHTKHIQQLEFYAEEREAAIKSVPANAGQKFKFIEE